MKTENREQNTENRKQRIVLLTLGTRGDVQPFVALGKRLVEEGHTVTVCTCARYEGFVRAHGLGYGYMGDEVLDFISTDRVKALIESRSTGVVGWVKTAFELIPKFKPILRQLLAEQWTATLGAEAIIYHPKALGGYHIAEALGVPGIMASPFPAYIPTGDFPLFIFPELNVGSWYNELTYALIPLGTTSYHGTLNKWRKTMLRLPPRAPLSHERKDAAGRPVPTMHCHSPHVVPVPADWPPTTIATGYWFLDEEKDWQPSSELMAFLEAGPPPVFVGFGSMVGRHPEALTEVVVKALTGAGLRGVLGTGWGGLEATDLPADIMQVNDIPYSWLFPRMAAVVHHGGAGSTAAGLRAGKPSIVCPFFADQPFWGRRVFKLGAGPEPIPRKKLTADLLRQALSTAVNDAAMQQRAAALGQQIQAEDGVGKAVSFLKQWL